MPPLCRKGDKSAEIKGIDGAAALFYRLGVRRADPLPPGLFMEDRVFHCPAIRPALTGFSALAIFAMPVAATAQGAPSGQESGATSTPLTRSQLSAQLEVNFKSLDTNGDKVLNAAEIEAAQKRQLAEVEAGLAKRLETEFARLDSNKDGQLSLTEFKAGAPGPRITPPAELVNQFDRNKDGKVSVDEYRAVPLANFDKLDANKDGTISAQERSAAKEQR